MSVSADKSRPIVVLGAGVLGRRIAAVFLAGGYTVHIRDPSKDALEEAASFINENFATFVGLTPSPSSAATVSTALRTFTEIPEAVQNAWMVVEAVPEKLELKIETLAMLDELTPEDCVFASNSSSFRSGLMIEKIGKERQEKTLNVHFTMPPFIRTVELMTDGFTKPEVFEVVSNVLRESGMIPVTAKRESTGFIFNRLWAAIKREILTILAEDVSSPEEIDLLWEEMFHKATSKAPCQMMDTVGLDTVAFIEDNYINERRLDGKKTVDWLRENYIKQGKLGLKSDKGGLYPPATQSKDKKAEEEIYVLDSGLGGNVSDLNATSTAGRIIRYNPETKAAETLVSGQSMPDGIDISKQTGRIFWSNMGSSTSSNDGSIHSCNLDGSDVQTVLPSGSAHTPKQLIVDDRPDAQKIYFCDREGLRIHRCNYDGSDHQILLKTGTFTNEDEKKDFTRWCVGITVDPVRNHLYWTQKGPSKAGQGRIFRAGLEIPEGQTAENRSDVEVILDHLPEPIDLEIDSEGQVLYWTDRGEHPLGCTLNKISVAGDTVNREDMTILARHFHEPIGLKLDAKKGIVVADLGGSVYRVGDTKKTLLSDAAAYTGVAIL